MQPQGDTTQTRKLSELLSLLHSSLFNEKSFDILTSYIQLINLVLLNPIGFMLICCLAVFTHGTLP